ncbi:MAG: isopenicillin N synthase family oxygenase, partial [Anaerolineales bacterium]|nr:isopenicillin N synthase family oxygenase [Anaerolineales bacterium]
DTTSTIKKAAKPNQSESFMMMHELPDDDPDVLAKAPLAGPNQWPAALPDFKPAVRAYNQALVDLGRRLVPAVAVALGAGPNDLNADFVRPTTFLRLLYYPSQPPHSPDDLFGSNPHTDYGFLTLLAQDDVGGLQVRNRAGDWVDAPYMPGALVMNSGDILHRWSNGYFISTPHRVINRSGRARYSCPFFFDPDMHSRIAPVPSRISADHPARFEPLVYGDFLMGQLRANHDQHAQRAEPKMM